MLETFPIDEEQVEHIEPKPLTRRERMDLFVHVRMIANPPQHLEAGNFDIPAIRYKVINGVRVDFETNEPLSPEQFDSRSEEFES